VIFAVVLCATLVSLFCERELQFVLRQSAGWCADPGGRVMQSAGRSATAASPESFCTGG